MTTNKKEIPVPDSLSTEQVNLAKAFVAERYETGISVNDFITKHGKSTATWYGDKYMKNPVFESYLKALGGAIVSDESWETYELVKKKIEKLATAEKAGVKEIQLYLQAFDFMVQADRQKQMSKLGIVPAHEKGTEKTLEERKANLLSRLKTNKSEGNGNYEQL